MSLTEPFARSRRLAAILAADVAGYSRLMEADEDGTLARLRAHRRELVDPKVREYQGRIVKTTGDGMLVEFQSVVAAVRCAVEVQRAMLDRESEVPDELRIRFRIGINLGDIVIDEDDIFGDGVNVAARLEAISEIGGICISGTVHEHIAGKLTYAFDDSGEQSVRNIARPLRVYSMSVASVAATSLVAIHGSVIATTGPKLAPRLSVLVLPFLDQSGDLERFVDVITDDVTTDLSVLLANHVKGSFVPARATALAYKGKALDVRQIGRELGVRYLVEGSVRSSGQQVLFNVQLSETDTGAHLWAERFEVDHSEVRIAQDEITGRLARTLQLELIEAAARRIEQTERAANLSVSDLLTLGWAYHLRPFTPEIWQRARNAFEQALELDPESADARIGIANLISISFGMGFSKSPKEEMALEERLLDEALQRDRNRPRAYFALGQLRRIQTRYAESRAALETGIALDRNDSGLILQLGITLMYSGDPDAALPHLERALRLNPRIQNVFYNYWWLSFCHILLNQPDQALDILMKKRSTTDPRPEGTHLMLAAAYGLKRESDQAKAALAEAIKLRPDMNSLARLLQRPEWTASSQFVALREKTVDVGLRTAGLPEE